MNLTRRHFRDHITWYGKRDFADVSRSKISGPSILGEPLKRPMPRLRDSSLTGRMLGSVWQGTAGGV